MIDLIRYYWLIKIDLWSNSVIKNSIGPSICTREHRINFQAIFDARQLDSFFYKFMFASIDKFHGPQFDHISASFFNKFVNNIIGNLFYQTFGRKKYFFRY
jgi:hypothetical protein